MSDILGPVDDGNGGKAYNTYRIYRKAAANAGEARTSAQDGNKIFSRKNTADDALHTRLDRWEVKLFDVVNTYDSGAVHSGASGDTGATWVGIKDAVTVAGGSSTKLDAYQSPAKAVLMLDVPVSDNNGGLTPEPDDGQDPCGKDGCKTVDLTLQKVWRNGQLERPDAITLEVTATYTNAAGEQVKAGKPECFKDDCATEERADPFTVTMTARENGPAVSEALPESAECAIARSPNQPPRFSVSTRSPRAPKPRLQRSASGRVQVAKRPPSICSASAIETVRSTRATVLWSSA